MSVSISWTKSWSSSDDGSILYGADLQNIQTNIESHTHTEDTAITATAAELNILDGATITTAELNQLDGVTDLVVTTNEFLCWENDIIAYENNLVYYR